MPKGGSFWNGRVGEGLDPYGEGEPAEAHQNTAPT